MIREKIRWKILIPVAAVLLVMAAAFILISTITFRNYEIMDLEVYARGLIDLIAEEVIDAEEIDGYLAEGRSHPGYESVEQRLYRLREAYPDVLYLYVYQIREDGYHVVFDLDTEDYPGSEPGSVEEFYPAFLKYIPDMLEGKEIPPVFSRELYGYVLTVCEPLFDAAGNVKCYICADCSMDTLSAYVRDVILHVCYIALAVLAVIVAVSLFATDRGVVRKMNRLQDRAYKDTLTGLQNRTAFYEYSDTLNKKIEAKNADFSLLMIDINYLKRMNDTYGHEEGNLYLQGAAELIRKVFGEDSCYRIGGDEFTVILEEKAQDTAEQKIREFREETARLQADDSLKPWEKVSAAAGMAKYEPGRDASAEEVLRRADEAMYRDKIAMKAARTDT